MGVARIQWVKDGFIKQDAVNIQKQTSNTFDIPDASFSDVGSYSVFVHFGGHSRVEYGPVHLSVCELFATGSNGGCLGVPTGDFTSGNNIVCEGTGFDKYKVYFPFYGPNATGQTGIFTNYMGGSNLDLTTCTNVNGTIDTAILFQGNWLGMPQIACNDNDTNCSASTILSSCLGINLSTKSGSTLHS